MTLALISANPEIHATVEDPTKDSVDADERPSSTSAAYKIPGV
jgi:hypothetical protein